MGPRADSAVFVDTNVLVYSSFSASPLHALARTNLSELEARGTVLWASRQVLREFIAVTTRSGAVFPEPDIARISALVRQFEITFEIADEDAAVTALLLKLLQSRTIQGRQIHDANVVATMQRYAIRSLLTHNTADFARYVPEIKILPLVH